MIKFVELALPVSGLLLTLVSSYLVWRRNTVVYSQYEIHFCGVDMARKLQWATEARPKRPILNAFDYKFRNIGLKHIKDFSFVVSGIGEKSHFCYHHSNSMADEDFQVEQISNDKLKITVKNFPSFEKFGFSILEGDHYSGRELKGSDNNYVIRPLHIFRLRVIFYVAIFTMFMVMMKLVSNAVLINSFNS